MRVFVLFLLVGLVACQAEAKRKRKFEGDFEFAEEDDSKSFKVGEKKRWIHDPSSDLCRPLNCKKKEICLLEDSFTAVCVSRKELKKNGDIVVPKSTSKTDDPKDEEEDDDIFYDSEDDADDEVSEDPCHICPVVKPDFICGTDNRTYSTLCRLDYHNCFRQTSVKVACKGFCPCKEVDIKVHKKQRQPDRLNNFMTKYKATLDKSGTISSGAVNGASLEKPTLKNDIYSYVPQEIKYDNKHYKYIKYTKYNKENNFLYGDDKEKLKGYNEVTDDKAYSNAINGLDPALPISKQCSPTALQAMGNRLLDWFSVVMADSNRRRRPKNKSKALFPSACKGEVRWMFQHLDENADSKLSLQELYDLENDQNEICLKPFLQQCDVDKDLIVSPQEWCKCFQRAERPCAAVRRKISTEILGVYVPECDIQGYYKSVQCHSAIGMCWCVDKHGVEFANTRTHSRPNCDTILPSNSAQSKQESRQSNSVNTDSDDEDDDNQVEGSADHPNDY
ncbi:proteoglycan Cow [Anthonomus grandis grandis]|uniref:proteoglycan Cow n=1 Tax=Anthonomus grandis grandis TaxID=2921223 RepID=UPI00216617D0|nr:proteoglycan Cow [Anthonomus grandis grandis]